MAGAIAQPPYRLALITGASSGIGRSLALGLAARGVDVVLAARRAPLLESLRTEILALGGRAHVAVVDVADGDATAAAIRRLDAELGGFDLIVANAGVGADDSAGTPPFAWEAMRDALHTNLCGAAATLCAVLPQMVKRRAGHLVAIGSLASFGALPGSAAYCTPKAGLHMLLDCLRLDTHRAGVRVTEVRVGFVRTAMVERSTIPLPFLLSPDEAARHILDRLPAGPATIDFPLPMVALCRLLAGLPEPLRRLLSRRQTLVDSARGPTRPV